MKNMVIAAVCASTALLCADSILTGDQLGDWQKLSGAGALAEVEVDGAKVFQINGSAGLMIKKKMDIDPAKTYQVSGQFRAAPETQAGPLYFGVIPYEANGAQILPQNVLVVAGSETQLAKDVQAEDVEIIIKDGSKWRPTGSLTIAFEIDETGKLADLPNRKLAPIIDRIEKQEDGTAKIILKSKINKAYPAETAVRQHAFGGSYMYTAAANAPVPAEWKSFSGVIRGEAAAGGPSGKWWKNTRKASIVILANYGGKPQNSLQFKDIKLEEVSR